MLTSLDALAVGVAAWRLGAGRARKEDPVQAGAGVELHAKPGDPVRAGQPLLTLHTDTPERFERAKQALAGAYTIGDQCAGASGRDSSTGSADRPGRPAQCSRPQVRSVSIRATARPMARASTTRQAWTP